MNDYFLQIANNELYKLSVIESSEMTEDEKQAAIENLMSCMVSDVEIVTTRGAGLLVELRERAEVLKRYENDLKSKRAKLEKFEERLTEKLTEFVRLNGGNVETPAVRLSIRKSEYVEIIDKSKIPAKFMVFPPLPEAYPDKIEIKKIIRNGGVVDGCELVERDNLQLK